MQDMAKKRSKKTLSPKPLPFPPEERATEVTTIGWMLCALFTLCAEAVGLAAKIFLLYFPVNDESLARLRLLPVITLSIGLVTGTFCLLLTPLVYRLRKTPPPDLVTLFAVLISLAPLATLLVMGLRG
jgi:hypothetical protein